MGRALSVAEQAGMPLLLVHALNDQARMNLQLLVKDIRLAFDGAD